MPKLEQLIQKIGEKTGKTAEEINGMVEAKKEKFSGLLTDEGAAYMIAREHNITFESPAAVQDTLTAVKDLQDGMQALSLELDVKHVFSPKTFSGKGKPGKLCSLIVGDETGETRLTVWNERITRLDGIEKGDRILVQNCTVKNFQDKPQLNLSPQGEITRTARGNDATLTKISGLKENMTDVSVQGTVQQQYGIRSFKKDQADGHITAFELEDESGSTRIAAWNELAEPAADLKTGDTIKIEGAYTKPSQQNNDLELHLGWRARIIKRL